MSVINDILKEYFEKVKINNLILNNVSYFGDMIYLIGELLADYIDDNELIIKWDKISKSDFDLDRKLIDEFFQTIGIDFKLEYILKNNVLHIHENNFEEIIKSNNEEKFIQGWNGYYKGGKEKAIEVGYTELITDSAIWVHEISHYLNQPDFKRTNVNDLITEGIAFTYELIYADFLEQKGYLYESYCIKNMILNIFYNSVCSLKSYFDFVELYVLYGDTSKEKFKIRFKTDDFYDELKQNFEKNYYSKLTRMRDNLFYTFASLIAVYSYEEYKKDNAFINNINKLNDQINIDNVTNCLKLINLDGTQKDIFDKVRASYKKITYDLTSNKKLSK